jgi:hypothetical protein
MFVAGYSVTLVDVSAGCTIVDNTGCTTLTMLAQNDIVRIVSMIIEAIFLIGVTSHGVIEIERIYFIIGGSTSKNEMLPIFRRYPSG